MKLEKVKSTPDRPNFNTYKAELSYGQLIAIRDALAKHHADPLADEMFEELSFFLDHLPRPGEEFDKESKQMVNSGSKADVDDINIDDDLPAPDGAVSGDDTGGDVLPGDGELDKSEDDLDEVGLDEPPAE